MVPAMSFRAIPAFFLSALLIAPAIAAPSKTAKAPLSTVESLLVQAHAADAKGDIELALRLTQSAIVADPSRPTSYVALGDLYAAAGQADYARNYYTEALEIDPAQPAALKAIAALDHTGHTVSTKP
jgi:tetratricopeptide (TPR) repeat protein